MAVLSPENGEIVIDLDGGPASLQSSKTLKEKYRTSIRAAVQGLAFFLTGEVALDIEWLLHERERYERPFSPDIDNILKPTLDALSGRDGILFDDCQIQSVSCRWIDWTSTTQHVSLRIRFDPDEWIGRENIVFVIVAPPSLCMPIDLSLPPAGVALIVRQCIDMFEARDKFLKLGWDYYSALRVLPIQRAFHKAQIKRRGFTVYSSAELQDVMGVKLTGGPAKHSE